MKRLFQLTVIALLASLAVSAEDVMAAGPKANQCPGCDVESGRYFEHQPVGPNNISNVRGARSAIVRFASGGVPDKSDAKAYVSVNWDNGNWLEFGVMRSRDPVQPVLGGQVAYADCANTRGNGVTSDAYPTSRIYAMWIDYDYLGNYHSDCVYGPEVSNNEIHQFRIQRCGTNANWCTYLDGNLFANVFNWGGIYLTEQADEVRIASEFNCQFEPCHNSTTTWANRFGGPLNWGVTNASTSAATQDWWLQHYVAGEAAKANTPGGYWVIENISTSNPWDIYHISA